MANSKNRESPEPKSEPAAMAVSNNEDRGADTSDEALRARAHEAGVQAVAQALAKAA